MKKTLILILLLCLMLTAFSACAMSEPVNLQVDNGVLTWNKVRGAVKYTVVINGVEYECDDNRFMLPDDLYGQAAITVTAVSSNGKTASAEIKRTITIKLATPSNISRQGNTVTWDAVKNAVGYVVKLNGVEYVASSNSYTLPDNASGTLYVLASGTSDKLIQSSDYSEPFTITTNTDIPDIPDVPNTPVIPEMPTDLVGISTEDELFALQADGHYKLTQNVTLTRKWLPLDFSGAFDGCGYEISGVVIDSDSANVGFFATIDGALIGNVTVKGSVTVTSAKPNVCVGALAGKAVNSAVFDTNVEMNIVATVNNGVGNVGGVVGSMQNTSMSKVNYLGTINAVNAAVGGFVGKAHTPKDVNFVDDCHVEATISAVGGEQTVAGGFIGMFTDNCLTVSNCSADVEVTGSVYVGGFVGYMGSGRIDNCQAQGEVTATNQILAHVGGFVGRLEGYNNYVRRCIAKCQVTAADGDNVCAGAFVGKTVGGTYNSVYDDCYYDASVCNLDRIGNPATGKGDGISAL